MTERRAVVVGAGLGGLYAACLLASSGAATTLIEKNGEVGGCASGLRLGEHRFDLGATMLQTPKVLHQNLELLGRRTEDYLELIPLDPIYRLCLPDGTSLELHRSIERTADAIGEISPRDRESFLRYMAETETLKSDLKKLFIDSTLGKNLDFLSRSGFRVFWNLNPLATVKTRMARLFRDPRLRDAFSFQVLYFGVPPGLCPAVYSMVPYFEIKQGVWHPRGGISSLARALAKIFSELGGELRTGTAARRIATRGGAAAGVELADGHLPADAVVSNADALYTYRRLLADADVPARARRRLDRYHLSCSSLVMLLGLAGRRDDLAHHTFFLPGDSQASYRAIFAEGRMPDELAAYLCCPTRTDPSMAPAGRESLYVLVPAPRRLAAGSWEERAEEIADGLLDKLEERGVRGLREQIVERRLLTPPVYESTFNLPDGMTFGLQPRLSQMGPLRPKVRSPYLRGLFLAGASVHPGAGIPLVLSSGRKAGEAAAEMLGGRGT